MENVGSLLQMMLDAGLLFLCCELMFRDKRNIKARDFILYPVIVFFCMVTRASLTAGADVTILFPSQGFEIAPADNLFFLLFLILAILLMNSLYYRPRDSSYTLCGSITLFSVYLLTRVISIIIFHFCKTDGYTLLFGSRMLSLVLAAVFLFSPVFEWFRQTIKSGGFGIKLLFVNVTLVLLILITYFSFDFTKLLEQVWMVALLLLLLFLFDSALLVYHQYRKQERKRVQMIEQYVPIVEELISQVRARQHEFHNRLLAIETAVMSSENLEEAKNAVSLLTDGMLLNATDQELLACDSKMVAGMLYGKIKQADFLQIHVLAELKSPLKKSSLPETAWVEVLGILLDNAIEASQKGDTVYIQACKRSRYTELTIANPFPPMSNTEFMQLFRKGITTKQSEGDTHGFGLYNVLTIAERYRGKIIAKNEIRDESNYVVFGIMVP